MSSRIAVVLAAVTAAAGLAVGDAAASRLLKVGVYDDAQIHGNPTRSFPLLRQLRAQVVRVNLHWGGKLGVARRRPGRGTDPDDPAYRWTSYDRVVRLARRSRIQIVFSIYGTPGWANGGFPPNRAPRDPSHLMRFAYAAAQRYSGTFVPEDEETALPAVRNWLAWNEPNSPVFLFPQYRRVRGRFVLHSPVAYARICNAVWSGVHRTSLRNERVACGVTAPRGNNLPGSRRPSVSPLAFLRRMKRAGARRFEAYAHHPYYGSPSESPRRRPASRTTVTLGNIDVLVAEVTRLYGHKRIWITEYGYQTRPPDRFFGVSWALQARYLREAFAIARRNPRIDMMLWFLLRDERRVRGRDGWQSGFLTVSGRRKPSFTAFRGLRR